ncbi:hypothetical protein BGZ72_006074 [Mortierella alpina]|nr:hypothetical protein BGZ72_006074 [Mortierella alpina]
MLPLPPLAKALPSVIPAANPKSLDSLGSNSSPLESQPSSGLKGVCSTNVSVPTPLVTLSGSSPAQLTPTTSFENGQLLEDLDTSVPILPSQLRRRHESMRLLARTAQKQQEASVHEPIAQDVPSSALHPQDGDDSKSLVSAGGQSKHNNNSSNNNIDSCLNGEDEAEDTIESIGGSHHPHTAIGTLPHSMLFEATTSDTIATLASLSAQTDLGFVEIPTRDWIQMQSKMQSLETEVFHVSRTNRLLNEELDKLTGILARLTAGGDELKNLDHEQKQVEGASSSRQPGWRREYEFLVQQVDLMHRQLQAAQSELGGRTTTQGRARAEDQMEVARSTAVTRQLHAEVKDLTASLKMWQSALQQTDNQYRRKCDDERALKQTLRERESELSSLVEKLEQSKGHSDSSSHISRDMMSTGHSGRSESGMPGTFPEPQSAEAVQTHATVADQLAVSLVSWAALLVTSMMS